MNPSFFSCLTNMKIILALLATLTKIIRLRTVSANFQPNIYWPDSSVKDLQVFGSGIAIDKNNNIIVLHRSNRSNSGSGSTDLIPVDTVFILDKKSGKVLRTWGKDKFVKPHGIEVTENGDIFITDVKLHQVLKFEYVASTEMWKETAVLTLGERFTPGSDAYHFCSPADVAVMPQSGDFFVADGYCNSRIVKFDSSGKYLLEFGAGSINPNIHPVPFNVTHSVVVAFPNEKASNFNNSTFFSGKNNEKDAIIFVADRNNGRIQCFSPNGTFHYEISYENFGQVKAMLLSLAHSAHSSMYSQFEFCNDSDPNYGTLFAINGHLKPGLPKVFEIAVSKFSAKLITSFPVTQFNNNSAEFETPHDIVVSKNSKDIYIIEASSNLTLRKFTNVIHSKSNVSFLSNMVLALPALYLVAFKLK